MKKIYSLVMMTVIALAANAQNLVFNENFPGYITSAPNNNLIGQGLWTSGGSTGTDVKVLNITPLTYTGYQSGAEYAQTNTGSGTDPRKAFTNNATITTSSNQVIYMSFVVRVISASNGNPGNGFQSLSLQTSNGNTPARFYIDRNSGNTAVRFGVAVGDESPAWTGYSYNFNQTYLIVMRYNSTTGNNNDDAFLWVNPSLASALSTGANASHTSSNGEVSNGSTFNGVRFNQTGFGYNTANAAFDGIRVAYGSTAAAAWTDLNPAGGSLPVVLTSFNATNEGLSTKLIWNAADENGFASYVIEKSTDGRTFNAIGTVNATNQKTYSFVDGAAGDNSYYRLKMVDLNGAFKYSYVVSIRSKVNTSISLSPNPVKSNLIIQHPKVTTESDLQVISANGQLVKTIRLASNAVITYIDMSGFTNGLYHIVYKNGSEMFTRTVIKQ